MRTMRKQFPVNWLTSGRFSAPKRGGVNKWKKWLPKWRPDMEKLVKTSTQTDPLQETVEIQLKRPRGPSFLLEQLERGQVAMRPGWALNTKCAGPTKTTVQATVWTYFISSGSQPVYRKLFPRGPHSSKNNFFEIKISRPTPWESLSVLLWLLVVLKITLVPWVLVF